MTDAPLRRLLALLMLALVLFNYPVLAVVEALPPVGGVPPKPFYIFAAWGLVIGLAAWIVERTERS